MLGFFTLSNRTVTDPGVIVAAVLVTTTEFADGLLMLVKTAAPVEAPKVAPGVVVDKPVGAVQVPLAIVQYSNLADPTVVLLGKEKVKRWFTVPPGNEPPSLTPSLSVSTLPDCRVKLRLVICDAYAGCGKDATTIPATSRTVVVTASKRFCMLKTTGGIRLPITLMQEYYHER
jgi:hypothetical protein